jgi:TonB family protein
MATIASHSAIGQFVPDFSSQFLTDLQGLLEKAGRFTGATSAAIAFVDGGELVTKVSMGECAPEPGSRSPISGSFTGLCVQSREVQRCDDASRDSRVDAGACQALGIASMVIVPIAEKRSVYGVLAAFSPKPNAFSPTHVALLRTISDIVIELRKRYPVEPAEISEKNNAPVEPVHAPEPVVPVQSTPEVKAPIASVLPTFGTAATPAAKIEPAEKPKSEPVMAKAAELHISMAAIPVPHEPAIVEAPVFEAPAVNLPSTKEPEALDFSTATEKKPLGPVLVKSESKPAPRIQNSVDLWKREPLLLKNETEPVEEYARLVTPEPVKKSDEILTTAADIGPSVVSKSDSAPTFGSYTYDAADALERQHRAESGSRKIILIAAVVVALVIAGGWYFTHRSSSVSPAEVQAAAPQTHIATPEPVASTPAPAVTEPAPVAAPVSSGPGIAMVVKKTDLNLNTSLNKKNAAKEPIAEDRTILVSNSASGPRRRTAADDMEVPKVASADSSGVGNLLNMVKTAPPEAAFKSSSIQAPQLLKSVAPQFPSFARQMHIQSDKVVLNGTVEKDGSVNNIKVVRGKQVFVQPAISAVKQWRYKAAMLNGEPTSSTIEIVVNFVDHN